ncbi:MAG: polyamine aminopropyltransferase [Bacteroidota bacterium]
MMETMTEAPAQASERLNTAQGRAVLVGVFLIAACGLIYELLIGTLSSYLFGNSVAHFSITIGLFMSAMGLGSLASRLVQTQVLRWFLLVELGVAALGGISVALLYGAFALTEVYHLAMGVLILSIGTLIGMEIPLVLRLLGGWGALRHTLGNVLALDYLGALVASVLFPLLLLPLVGVLHTALVTGLLNLLVVGVLLHLFRAHRAATRGLKLGAAVLAVGLLAGLIWASSFQSFVDQRLYRDPIILTEQTRYQRVVLTRWQDDLRLFLDGNLQFSALDEHRYHDLLVHPAMAFSASRQEVLLLGGGDGLALREVLRYPDVERVVLVDLDPAVTDLARTHPLLRTLNQDALADPRVEVINQDAFAYLRDNAALYGVILIDLPDPNNESLGKLYTRAFYRLAQRHLAVGGYLVTQATSPYATRQAYWSIVQTMDAEGLATVPYHHYVPSFGQWGFVLAGRQAPSGPLAPRVPMRHLTPALWEAARVFDSDTGPLPAAVNTLDHPVLLRYYHDGWRQHQ